MSRSASRWRGSSASPRRWAGTWRLGLVALSALPDLDVVAFAVGIPYAAPWRPIPVAPIGAAMLSARGLEVVMIEAMLFLPLFVIASVPSRRDRPSRPRPRSGAREGPSDRTS